MLGNSVSELFNSAGAPSSMGNAVEGMFKFGGILMIIAVIFSILFAIGFVYAFIKILKIMFTAKDRSGFVAKQAEISKTVLNDNKEILKDIATMQAEIKSEGMEVTARAIKKGFTEEESAGVEVEK